MQCLNWITGAEGAVTNGVWCTYNFYLILSGALKTSGGSTGGGGGATMGFIPQFNLLPPSFIALCFLDQAQ